MDTLRALLATPKRRNTAAIAATLRTKPTATMASDMAVSPPMMTFFIDSRSFIQPVGKEKTMGAEANRATITPMATPSNPSLRNWSGARKATVVTAIVRMKLTRWTRRMPAIISKMGDMIPIPHFLRREAFVQKDKRIGE